MADGFDVAKSIWKVLFERQIAFNLDHFVQVFCSDVPLPHYVPELEGEGVVAISKPFSHVISQQRALAQSEKFDKTPRGQFVPAEELLQEIIPTLSFSGNNCYDSSEVVDSDNIFKSTQIYLSRTIHQSKQALCCANSIGLEMAAACDSSGYSQFVMRVMDSGNCSRCFEVYQSGKCSGAYFMSNCYDMHDCILCINMRSKRFCIGNRQFSEQEYKKLKPRLLELLVLTDFHPMYTLRSRILAAQIRK